MIFRWLMAAFSMYSRIPMPHFTWKDGDAEHSLIFLPIVGAVIGGLIFWVNVPADLPAGLGSLPAAVRVFLTLFVPVIVTGGFHLDGFMDTEDALRSYGSREKKLEILKDPHIGAFAVIGLVRIGLIFATAVTMLLAEEQTDARILGILSLIFVTGRCLSGVTSLLLQKAKREGMLYEETKGKKRLVICCLITELIATAGLMIFLDVQRGGIVCLAFALSAAYYCLHTRKIFGGVTGDTAGHFLTSSEAFAAVALAVSGLLPL